MRTIQNYKKWWFLLPFILLAIFHACTSEQDYTPEEIQKPVEPLSVATAQSLYEQYVGKTSRLKSTTEDSRIDLFPDWNQGQLFSDSNWYVVESPLEIGQGKDLRFALPEVQEYSEANHVRPQQIFRQIVMRNKETGLDYAFMMVVMPELEYMLRKGDELDRNQYLTRTSDLSGTVLFYTTSGEMVNGWKYKDGNITAAIAAGSDQSYVRRTKIAYEYECVTTIEYHSDGTIDATLNCYKVYLLGEVTVEGNGPNLSVSDPFGSSSGGSGPVSPTLPPISIGRPNSSNDKDPVADKAKSIFRNSNMTKENWEKLEKMLDKITQDCMGEAIYNGLEASLNGKTLTIQFVNGDGSYFNYSDYNGYSVGILLSTSMESNQLYHEMMHAYQAYQETEASYRNSIINIEIEAFYGQYLYLSKLPEYKGSKWEQWYKKNPLFESIKDLEKYISNKGNLIPGVPGYQLDNYILGGPVAQFQQDKSYKYEKYDYSRSSLDNFKNIRTLTKNCQ
jgi:hypothetical protein